MILLRTEYINTKAFNYEFQIWCFYYDYLKLTVEMHKTSYLSLRWWWVSDMVFCYHFATIQQWSQKIIFIVQLVRFDCEFWIWCFCDDFMILSKIITLTLYLKLTIKINEAHYIYTITPKLWSWKCYIIVVTQALVLCLICPPSALRPAALWLQVYRSGRALMPALQLLNVPVL